MSDPVTTTIDLYLIMVLVGSEWIRSGRAYRNYDVAKSWRGFARKYHRARESKVIRETVTLIDDVPSPQDVERFSEKYNIDLVFGVK